MDRPAKLKARILVVDDKDENLTAMRAVLEPLDEELVFCSSGAEALRALMFGEFALILLDVQMPEMDGLETAALIRTRERTRHVPIMFVTALARETAWVTQGYAHGAADYLLKPLDPQILIAKVSTFAELWRRGKLLEQRAAEVERARISEREARLSSEFEQQLVGIVSHDIRSPLSAVKATASALLMDRRDPAVERGLQRICRGANRIDQLTNLLLDFTRARLGGGIPVAPAPADLREVCRAVVDETVAGHPDRQVQLSFDDGDGMGSWDAARLTQVLTNLVDNASKYGTPGKPIQVTGRLTGETVSISVHNEGDPIKPELLPVLFEPFSRGQQTEATTKLSLGLGLYIVKAIVDAHGGDVGVVSDAVSGTTFTVTLPRRAAIAEELAPGALPLRQSV
ncbi:MAG: ATP-binding protein [Myxococcaceae bacterium]